MNMITVWPVATNNNEETETVLWTCLALKKVIKSHFLIYPWTAMQDIQALGKAFSPQPSKEIIQHFKNDIFNFFLFS
jgi:hypothetical protein